MNRVAILFAAVIVASVFGPARAGAETDRAAPASRPMARGELKNEKCPLKGKPARADKSLDYADDEAGVYGRIHFCCDDCLKRAESMDQAMKKELYEKAFLTRAKGKARKYGSFRMKLGNKNCPVTGEEGIDDSAAIHFNAVQVNICCPGCSKEFFSDPDKYLHNVNNDIDAALKKLEEKKKEKKTGAEK